MKCKHLDKKVMSILELSTALSYAVHSFIWHIIIRDLQLGATVSRTWNISKSKTCKHFLSLRFREPSWWFCQLPIVATIHSSTREKYHRVSGPIGPPITHTQLVHLTSPSKSKQTNKRYTPVGVPQWHYKTPAVYNQCPVFSEACGFLSPQWTVTVINGYRSLRARLGGSFIV